MAGIERQGSAGFMRSRGGCLRVVDPDAGDSLALPTDRLVGEVDSIVRTFFQEADRADLLPELSPQLQLALKRGVEAGVRDALQRLREPTPNLTRLPIEMEAVARLWARERCELSRLIEVVDLARDVVRPAFERFAEEAIPDAEARWALMIRAHDALAGWTRSTHELLHRSYDAERHLARRRISSERALHVSRILAGDSSAAAELGYDLSLEHLAVIAWNGEPHSTVKALARRCRRELLAVDGPNGAVWAWLGGIEPLAASVVGELVAWQRQRDGSAAFGEPAARVEGFRQSHEQAQQAREYAALHSERAARYDDIVLLALAAREPRRADAFARHELDGLLDDTPRSGELRATLAAYLRSGQSIKATALIRGVHRQTVRQQIRTIETRLRYPISDRSAELMLALRLRQLTETEPSALQVRQNGGPKRQNGDIYIAKMATPNRQNGD